mmetsp:Transcript_32327/g.86638  ORF Transcript_32327/g.86638 Transcript_32327/m.86638 type:complete len:314 (+) Transcript_32327:178-1119(+)
MESVAKRGELVLVKLSWPAETVWHEDLRTIESLWVLIRKEVGQCNIFTEGHVQRMPSHVHVKPLRSNDFANPANGVCCHTQRLEHTQVQASISRVAHISQDLLQLGRVLQEKEKSLCSTDGGVLVGRKEKPHRQLRDLFSIQGPFTGNSVHITSGLLLSPCRHISPILQTAHRPQPCALRRSTGHDMRHSLGQTMNEVTPLASHGAPNEDARHPCGNSDAFCSGVLNVVLEGHDVIKKTNARVVVRVHQSVTQQVTHNGLQHDTTHCGENVLHISCFGRKHNINCSSDASFQRRVVVRRNSFMSFFTEATVLQ